MIINATVHLLEILKLIFDPQQIIDEKSAFREWIKKWIKSGDSINSIFGGNNEKILNNERLQRDHRIFSAKYSQCFLTYNNAFITDLLSYVSSVYYNLFNKNSHQLKQCINYLNKLKQNMFYQQQSCNKEEVFSKSKHYQNKFENYGRALLNYYSLTKTPFIIDSFLKNNYNEKVSFYNLITLVVSNDDDDDDDWLRFLHGPILNIEYAKIHHSMFCSKYQTEKDVWCCDIDDLIADFATYLDQINKTLYNEKLMECRSEEMEIWFPNIPPKNNNDDDDDDDDDVDYENEDISLYLYNNSKSEKILKQYYNYNITNRENYDYILKEILPLLSVKYYTVK